MSPSIEIRLSSQTTHRLPSLCRPARELASPEIPSSRSPSEAMTHTRWSKGLASWSGRVVSSMPFAYREAMAIPTAVAKP